MELTIKIFTIDFKKNISLHFQFLIPNAQVAELVDALVSNTNEVTLVPVRPRPWVQKHCSNRVVLFL